MRRHVVLHVNLKVVQRTSIRRYFFRFPCVDCLRLNLAISVENKLPISNLIIQSIDALSGHLNQLARGIH